MPIDDDDKRMPERQRAGRGLRHVSKRLDRKLKAELGVASVEQL